MLYSCTHIAPVGDNGLNPPSHLRT